MLSGREILFLLVIPACVGAAAGAAGRWRRWGWTLPAGTGAGFLLGCLATVGLPRLPPRDGTDWLIWAALPLTLVATADALSRFKLGWLFGAVAGGAAWLIVAPLAPAAVTSAALWVTTLGCAVGGAVLCAVVQWAERRLGTPTVLAGLAIIVGGAGVLVFSSNLRIVGLYGLAAAAALAPTALLSARSGAGRSVAVLAVSLLAGLLVGGLYYPEPGISPTALILLMSAPLLMLPAALLPARRRRARGVAALISIAVLVAAIVGPAALAAKRAAENDPYQAYGG